MDEAYRIVIFDRNRMAEFNDFILPDVYDELLSVEDFDGEGVIAIGALKNGEPILLFRKGKAYVDLSVQHTLSSPDTAYRIVHKAYDKSLIDLAVDEYIHIVELRRKKKAKTEIIYEYCADHNNDWGEIRYTPGADDYDVVRYVYTDEKGGFFFVAAGDWIVRQAAKEQFPQTAVIPITKI